MQYLPVPKSGLTRRQRIRAMLPVFIVAAALVGFGVFVQRGREFHIVYFQKESRRPAEYPFLFPMVAHGLFLIENVAGDFPWFDYVAGDNPIPQPPVPDVRVGPPANPPSYRNLPDPPSPHRSREDLIRDMNNQPREPDKH